MIRQPLAIIMFISLYRFKNCVDAILRGSESLLTASAALGGPGAKHPGRQTSLISHLPAERTGVLATTRSCLPGFPFTSVRDYSLKSTLDPSLSESSFSIRRISPL